MMNGGIECLPRSGTTKGTTPLIQSLSASPCISAKEEAGLQNSQKFASKRGIPESDTSHA